jgi:hypothetical protein
MNRKITDFEKIYQRVRDFIKNLPSDILANFRVYFSKSKVIDFYFKRIRENTGAFTFEYKNEWFYCFLYGENEFNEFLRQLL